jgi:long-chain acyl-CoA synthetase
MTAARAGQDAAALPEVFPSVVHMLAAAAKAAPEREAVSCGGTRLTYAEYLRCVGGLAGELQALGAKGNRVALVCGNSVEMAVATFAVHASGAAAVPVNPIYTPREMGFILEDADPLAVIHDEAAAATVVPLAEKLGIAHRIEVGPQARDILRWRGDAGARLPDPLPGPDELGTIQYTGGTTGRSKGACLTHGALAINISQREALVPSRKDVERMLCVMPLFHVYASHCCLHTMAYARGTLAILPRYHPQETLDALAAQRITIFAGSPTIFTGLLGYEGFAQADLSALRFSYSGSAPLPEEVLTRWEAATGTPIIEGYGQSEAGPVVSFNPLEGVRKAGSVGVPVPQTEVQIVDAETGTTVLGTGEKGEIRVRGPQIMTGYRNMAEETAATLRGGWLHTGDIGEFDADGYLFIRDRKKDMALVGGYNVYPREIDEVLYGHPAVLEAAAVGVPDDYRGEIVKAQVVLRPGANATVDELIAHCRANLAKYKVPAEIAVVPALPKTTVGKIDKKTLKASLGG